MTRPADPARRRLFALAMLATAGLLAAHAAARGAEPDASPARAALAREGYPWYDASSDRVVPVLPRPDFNAGTWKVWGDWFSNLFRPIGDLFRWLNFWRIPYIGNLGDVAAVGLALLLLTVLLVALTELLRRYRPGRDDGADAAGGAVRPAGAQRIEGLPAGVRLEAVDPWAEAQRRRARGDLAGAVVYLFAHQLLTLDRLRLVRLVPGRTGRQLVRTIADTGLRAGVEPTLRLFEAVYYGHRAPTPEAFEAVWTQAQALEARLSAAGGAA